MSLVLPHFFSKKLFSVGKYKTKTITRARTSYFIHAHNRSTAIQLDATPTRPTSCRRLRFTTVSVDFLFLLVSQWDVSRPTLSAPIGRPPPRAGQRRRRRRTEVGGNFLQRFPSSFRHLTCINYGGRRRCHEAHYIDISNC